MGSDFVRVSAKKADDERRLLSRGLSIKEVAIALAVPAKRLEERNRFLYRIDLESAFERRIQRDGLPSRLSVDDAFGYWFSGLFDGEGHFVIQLRAPRQHAGWNLQLGLNVALRDDDAQVLQYVHESLGGVFRATSKNNVAHWRLRGLATMAEVVVPLFDRYPLRSKKAQEFEVIRGLVLKRYIVTLGGKRRFVPIDSIAEITAAIADIRSRRRYSDRSSWHVDEDSMLSPRVSSFVA